MKKILSIFTSFALAIGILAPLSNVLAYGSGGGGGSVVSTCRPAFYDITPAKDANLSSLSTVEFSLSGSQLSGESDYLSLMVNDDIITPLSITEKSNGDLKVSADVSSYITNGVNKITLWAKTQRSESCQRTFAYFITISEEGSSPVGDDDTTDDTTPDSDDTTTGSTPGGSTGSGSGSGSSSGFNDTRGHWASYYIEQLRNLGVISGDANTGNFRPDSPINRVEIVKMILKALNISIPASVLNPPFSDVPVSSWFAVFVAKAKELGIVGGYPDGNFRPGNSITRAEVLKIALMAAGLNVSTESTDAFEDVSSSAWYYRYVAYAYNNGIITGYADGTFKPDAPITRAEAAKIISRLLDHLGWA